MDQQSNDWKSKKIDKYVIVNEILGTGAFGTVFRGFFQSDNTQQVAVKSISIEEISKSSQMVEIVKREINNLQKLNHPNIIRLYDVARTPHNLYMFLEYCADGDLKEYLQTKSHHRLAESEAVIFFKHIVEGFQVLYSNKIIHRDIKPANIMLHDGNAKISDFGFSRMLESGDMNRPQNFTRLGSPLYMAPQLLEEKDFSSRCDVWSVGIVFYEMLYGETPWIGTSQTDLIKNIKEKPLKFPKLPVRSQKVKELITLMLAYDQNKRLSWDDVFNHEIVKTSQEHIIENAKSLMISKSSLDKSIGMNKLYVERNLVAGYINKNVKPAPLDEQKEDGSKKDSSTSDSQISTEIDATKDEQDYSQVIEQHRSNEKMRSNLLSINTFMLYERNIAIFFNYVVQKIYMHQDSIAWPEDLFFKILFVLSKNTVIKLNNTLNMLKEEKSKVFNKKQKAWNAYRLSTEYKRTFQIVSEDMNEIMGIFKEITERTKELIELTMKTASEEKIAVLKEFLTHVNQNLEENESFVASHQQVVDEAAQIIKPMVYDVPDPQVEIVNIYKFILVCANPYKQFSSLDFDFNLFYEEGYSMSGAELRESVLQKLLTSSSTNA